MSQELTSTDDIVQLTAFKVGGEEYVVDILRIREIIKPLPVTPVRRGPRFVEGVISLRGAIIPVVDMRRRFGVKPSDDEELRERVIILVIDSRVVGLIVDKVTEVVRVPRTQIRPAPGLLADDQAPFFMGVCHYRNRVLILLNVRSVVESEEEIDVMDAHELASVLPDEAGRAD
jgi:purine-binding chemotaxis protein CheW